MVDDNIKDYFKECLAKKDEAIQKIMAKFDNDLIDRVKFLEVLVNFIKILLQIILFCIIIIIYRVKPFRGLTQSGTLFLKKKYKYKIKIINNKMMMIMMIQMMMTI